MIWGILISIGFGMFCMWLWIRTRCKKFKLKMPSLWGEL